MTGRAPIVKYGEAETGTPDVSVKPAMAGHPHRFIRVHWHAEPGPDGPDGAHAVLKVYRGPDGVPVIEVVAHVGDLHVNPYCKIAAREIASRRGLSTEEPRVDIVCAVCTRDRGHVVAHPPPLCAVLVTPPGAKVDDIDHPDREFWATWDDERR